MVFGYVRVVVNDECKEQHTGVPFEWTRRLCVRLPPLRCFKRAKFNVVSLYSFVFSIIHSSHGLHTSTVQCAVCVHRPVNEWNYRKLHFLFFMHHIRQRVIFGDFRRSQLKQQITFRRILTMVHFSFARCCFIAITYVQSAVATYKKWLWLGKFRNLTIFAFSLARCSRCSQIWCIVPTAEHLNVFYLFLPFNSSQHFIYMLSFNSQNCMNVFKAHWNMRR